MTKPIFQATEVLYRLSGCIRAVQGGEVNLFSRAIEVLRRVADGIEAPVAIVGGLAGIHHQVLVTTLDIDIVVSRDRLDAFLAEARAQGLLVKNESPLGWHRLAYRDEEGTVDIEVIPEGAAGPRDPEDAPPIPSPQELGVEQGLGYASFAGWVAMKLVAGRDKDRYHLGEALKNASQARIAEAVVKLRRMSPRYLKEFERILRAAESEGWEDR